MRHCILERHAGNIQFVGNIDAEIFEMDALVLAPDRRKSCSSKLRCLPA
jgi:hypothetical protein